MNPSNLALWFSQGDAASTASNVTVTVVMGANIVALCGAMIFAGRLWQRFLDVEKKVQKVDGLERLVRRIADKMGIPTELPGSGD